MNNIIYDEEIITPKDNAWKYYYNLIVKLDKKDCVKFSLFCAKTVNPNTKESNHCIILVEKWLLDEKSVNRQELLNATNVINIANAAIYFVNIVDTDVWTAYATSNTAFYAISSVSASYATSAVAYATNAVWYAININSIIKINNINKYLQILLRETKQFQNNKILEQISKGDVDKLELVDWNMITDIMQEDYNIVHEFEYCDIFSRRCLIELLRKEYP